MKCGKPKTGTVDQLIDQRFACFLLYTHGSWSVAIPQFYK